jgi:hypothetical protein
MSVQPKSNSFYMNILLLNKDEVVAAKVGEKTGFSKGGFFDRAASSLANSLVNDAKIIDSLAETLISKISEQTMHMGIIASVAKRFQQGSFVVLKVNIEEIDRLALVLVAKGPDFAKSFSTLLQCISNLGMDAKAIPNIDEKISKMVLEGMMTKFEEMVPQKMAESGLDVHCTVVSCADQAEYLFNMLDKLNSAHGGGK